jgi:hypothetical protein
VSDAKAAPSQINATGPSEARAETSRPTAAKTNLNVNLNVNKHVERPSRSPAARRYSAAHINGRDPSPHVQNEGSLKRPGIPCSSFTPQLLGSTG